jgi:ribosomal protein S12 methylthiotransferase accessory factor
MRIEVTMLDGQKLKASFGEYEIISDQSREAGGQEQYPEPFSYFLASMPLCAAFYIRKFCEQRDICTNGIKVFQDNSSIGEDKYQKKFSISVELPSSFPKKYKKAVMAAANTCTVKKVVQAMPEFEISIAE